VVQTHGIKLWEVHHRDGERPCDAHDDCRVDDVLLRPGVSMYLPTGTPHAARTHESASLHITLGINQQTWADLLRRAIRPLLDDLEAAHLPAGWLDHPQVLASGLEERLSRLGDDVRRIDGAEVAAAETERFLSGRPPRLRGGVSAVLAARQLGPDTRVRRRPGVPCLRRPRGDRLVLLLGDRSLEVPAWVGGAVDELRPGRALAPRDLPISPESAVVLCRRLMREGLLEPA
jgi:hypothetical protein